jgi:DUF4097 and DUF4098 domain-containing protein YvlB
MRKRDFVLLIFILLVGGLLHLGEKIRRGQLPLGIEVEGLDFLQGPLRTFSDVREAPLAPGGRLEVLAARGDVEVLTWDEPKVRVEVRKQFHCESEKQAAGLAGSLRLRLEPAGDSLRAEVVPDPGVESPEGYRTDFTLTVPPGARLEITSRYGGVEIRDIAGATVIHAAHGDVDAANLGGSCEITNRHGAVTVTGVKGNLRIFNEHDDVAVRGAQARVEIDSSRGSVTVEDAAGDVQIRSRRGEVRVERAGGDVRVEAGRSAATLQKIAGAVTATVEADPLEVTEVGGPVTVQADVTSVRLLDVSGKIQVTGRHTDVTVIRPGSDVDVQTSHQGIDLAVPAEQGFRVEATSESGEIESNLPGLHLPAEPLSHFAGTQGNGRFRYRLSTSYSTIRLEKTAAPGKS